MSSPDRRTVRTIHRRLVKHFGALEAPRRTDPLDELISTVLSQHTSDVNAERAFENLRARYPTWDEVVRARPSALAEVIRSGGLANTKAPRIQAILREIRNREGRYDLSFLRRRSDAEANEYLLSLSGVGPKTAAVVLALSLGRATIPVDTHVHRVTKRLGLVPSRSSAEKAHVILEELVPEPIRVELHIGLIRLGREICKAGQPRCADCPLMHLCPTAPLVLGIRPVRRGSASPKR